MRRKNSYYIYIMSNYSRQVIYTGVTNNIIRRVIEHQNGIGSFFTKKYNLKYLVYYEQYGSAGSAIYREKEIKGWSRVKKINLIRSLNPHFFDLSKELFKNYCLSESDILRLSEELKSLYKIDSSPPRAYRND